MEENREQPIITPATALNRADDECAMSEIGSQTEDLGKFKSVQALMDAYNNLQAEFTKKCQMLSQLQKDKTTETEGQKGDLQDNYAENDEKTLKNDENPIKNEESEQKTSEELLNSFLESNEDANMFVEELKQRYSSQSKKNLSPYEVAWAEVVLSHLKEGDKINDPIINQYVLSDENVKNKIVKEYIQSLDNSKPPIIISSQSGERLSGVVPDSPTTLAEAKRLVDKMFS